MSGRFWDCLVLKDASVPRKRACSLLTLLHPVILCTLYFTRPLVRALSHLRYPRNFKLRAPDIYVHITCHLSKMHFLLLLALPTLSSCVSFSETPTPYGSWNLSVVGGFAVSGYRWQDMLAEFSYSNEMETTPTIITECNWFYDPRIFGYSTPPGTCNSTLFRYDWPNEGAGVTGMCSPGG